MPADAASLPRPRGRTTTWLFSHLRGESTRPSPAALAVGDPLVDDDFQLALYCYELHYRGFRSVDPDLEWDPEVLRLRQALESAFLSRLLDEAGPIGDLSPADAEARLLAIADADGGPSLSREMQRAPSLARMREFCVHRSAYQLKEADPHTWMIPRLSGDAKAAVVEIQSDEYGGGLAPEMHAALFADTMRGLGLDARYGAYLDIIPGSTLATTNLISYFGLHRRWRGALIGHLALFEMTSVGPMGRYASALDRLGVGWAGRRFYEVHVEADEEHQHIALERMVRGLLQAEPQLAGDVVFGATALAEVERRFADRFLSCWRQGRSSLLPGAATAGLAHALSA